MKTTVKQFVQAVHEAWAEDFFRSATPIKAIKYSCSYGIEYFYVQCIDGDTHVILTMEDGRISFF